MYRVGFGDCFLVSIPQPQGPSHLLVDCGVHARGNINTMDAVVRNIEQECAGRLAAVIATHEHQDHISGFASCASIFSRIAVGEVWLPWVLDPGDSRAAELRRARLAMAQELWRGLAAGPDSAARNIVFNLLGNDDAMETLRGGFANKAPVRYLEAGMELVAAAGIAGLTVKVLGPPRDADFLAKMDPPAGNHYLADAAPEVLTDAKLTPFRARWRLEPPQFRRLGVVHFSRAEENAIRKCAQGRAEPLAAALDRTVNNTSIVILISFAGHHLLFAGDAQWGNWYWAERKEDLLKTLGEIAFYKVAHHGSFNATPKDALEAMPEGRFAAMVSTQSKPWPSIPRLPLIAALQERTGGALVRSDAIPVKGAPAVPMPGLPDNFALGDLWADYFVAV